MPSTEDLAEVPVFGELEVAHPDVKATRNRLWPSVALLCLFGLIASLGLNYVQTERYDRAMATQAIRRYRTYYEGTKAWPLGSDQFLVPGETDLRAFSVDHDARYTVDESLPDKVILRVTYTSLFSTHVIEIDGVKNPDGFAKLHTVPLQEQLPD